MVWSTSSYSTGETNAYNADRAIVVPENVLRSSLVGMRWTTTGTQAGTDVTDGASPVRRAYDGRGTRLTRFSGTQSTIYLNIQIAPSTIDTICIIFTSTNPTLTCTVQIADDAAFTTNVVDFAGPFPMETGARIVRTFGGTRYTGVEYVRLRFVATSGNLINQPSVGEVFLGSGFVFSHGIDQTSDPRPLRSGMNEHSALTGDVVRYPKFYGREMARHEMTLATLDIDSMNDVATVRSIATNSRSHGRALLYIPRPVSEPRRALLGFFASGIDMPKAENENYEYDLNFDEQPPLQNIEVSPPSFVSALSYTWDNTSGGASINLGDIAQFDGLTRFTYCGWIRINTANAATQALFAKTNGSAGAANAQGCLGHYLINPRTLELAFPTNVACPIGFMSSSLSASAWHFFCWVFDGNLSGNSNRLTLRIDNSAHTLNYGGTIPASLTSGTTSNARIGSRSDSDTTERCLTLNLDEQAFWLGTAASGAQQDALWNGGVPVNYTTTPIGQPSLWYRADGDSGGTAIDRGSLAINGTYTGNVATSSVVPP